MKHWSKLFFVPSQNFPLFFTMQTHGPPATLTLGQWYPEEGDPSRNGSRTARLLTHLNSAVLGEKASTKISHHWDEAVTLQLLKKGHLPLLSIFSPPPSHPWKVCKVITKLKSPCAPAFATVSAHIQGCLPISKDNDWWIFFFFAKVVVKTSCTHLWRSGHTLNKLEHKAYM